jgi:hypothetical protein
MKAFRIVTLLSLLLTAAVAYGMSVNTVYDKSYSVESFGYGFPRRWRWGWGPDIWTRYYTEGSLIVDFIDPQTGQLIWRGIVTDTAKTGGAESEKQVNKGAQELVKHFIKDMGRKKK